MSEKYNVVVDDVVVDEVVVDLNVRKVCHPSCVIFPNNELFR